MDDMNSKSTIEELSKHITEMVSGKAPSSNSIPSEFLSQCKICLLPLLHEIVVKCLIKGEVPQDIRYANTITL